MAMLQLIDPAGQTLSYETPADDALWTLGSAEGSTIALQGEGIAPQHATLSFAGGRVMLSPAEGAVLLHQAALTEPALVEPGSVFELGGYRLTLATEAAPSEAPAEPAAAAKTKAAPKAAPARRSTPTRLPKVKKENPIVTLITPLYVIIILAAAFVAGLTLRFKIMTGGFLPDSFFR
ncbi:MAG: FHA domain-containing protein [Akkermansia sp.]